MGLTTANCATGAALLPSVGFQRRPGARRTPHQAMPMHQQMHRIVGDIEQLPGRLAQQRFVAAMHAIDQVITIELRTQHR